jgi:heptosyltransferase I
VNKTQQLDDICILRLSAIGDVCHAVAAVQSIQRHYPKAKITWVIGKVEAMLLKGLPGVKLIIFDKKQGRDAYKQLKNHFKVSKKGQQFDVLLHMQVALRANLVTTCIPAKVKIGFDWSRAKEGHAIFTNKRISPASEPHVLEGFQDFAKAIGVPVKPPAWQMPYTEQDSQFAQQVLQNFEPSRQKLLVISPAASKKERNWLPERYAAVAKHANKQGFKVVLTGGPTDMEYSLSNDIQSHCPFEILDLVGKTSLKQLLCVLKAADIVLAPDSGPAHMAVTMATPVIGLYAHSNPKRTGPYSFQHYAVEVYHKNLQQQFGKTAAQLPWGKRCKGKDLMSQIQTREVTKMFDRVVKEKI